MKLNKNLTQKGYKFMPNLPNKEKSKSIARRAGWLLLTLLFVVTGLGVGVVAFWQATHQPKTDSSQTTPPPPPTPPTSKANKLEGTQMQDFTPVNKIDSLQKIDTKEGTGKEAAANSTVTVHYTGAVAATGKIFQSSLDTGQPVSFPLNQVIKGWSEGVPGMKEGGVRRLLIPADQAYGANPPQGSNIPPNADLVFDITLVSVK
jgi:FKBP-type peptidyl-prolyl cis-trans isomerase